MLKNPSISGRARADDGSQERIVRALVNQLRAALAGALVSASLPLLAGVNTFTGGGPEGGDIRQVEFQPGNGAKAVAMTPAGLYRGTDGGIEWTLVNDTVASTPFAIHPTNADRLYVVSGGDILLSTDGGTTLTALENWPGDANATAIDVGTDGIVYAGTSADGAFRSDDGGDSWTNVKAGLPDAVRVDTITVDPDDSNVVYATFGSFARGVYRTDNGGQQWTARNGGLPDDASKTVWEVAIDPEAPANIYAATDAGVYYSTNRGGAWQLPTTPVNDETQSVAVDPSPGSSIVYAGGPGGSIFKSSDAGHDWVPADTGFGSGTVRSITASTDGVTVLAGTTAGMNRSANAATTWEDADAGIVASNVVALAADPKETGTLIASASGLFKSTHAGSSWTNLTDNGTTDLVIDPANAAIVYGAINGVQKSVDGGLTWTALEDLTADTDALAFSPADGAVYAVETNVADIYRTTNGGTDWESAGTGVVDSRVLVLLVDALDGERLYLGSEADGLWRSVDAGLHWEHLAELASGRVSGIVQDSDDPSTLVAATEDGVFRSTDAGDTWESTAADLIESLTIDEDAPEILYGTGAGVVRSLDRGASWAPIPSDDPQSWLSTRIVLDARVRFRVYAGTSTKGVQVIDLAHDLRAEITGPSGDVGLNSDFEYEVTVTNAGPGPAPRVELSQTLPVNKANFVDAEPDQGDCNLHGSTLTCTLGVLEEGQSVAVLVRMNATDPGVLASTATASGFDSELQPNDNTATASGAQVAQLYDLAALIDAPASVAINQRLTYTASAVNNGPNAASGVTLVHEIPAGTTFISAVTDARCTRDVTVLTCTIGGLSAGESDEVEVTVEADEPGSLTSTSTVSANGGTDSNPDNDTATATTQSTGESSGGGGGGLDWLTLLALTLVAARARIHSRR